MIEVIPRDPSDPSLEIRLREVVSDSENDRKLKIAAEYDFLDFIKTAWPIAVPGEPFQENWHVRAICDHLQALAEGKFNNLLINMPPRHGKSVICSVMFPAWLWIVDPAYRMIYASYSQTFAMRDSRETHRLITSPWYQNFWGDRYSIAPDADAQVRFETYPQKGFRVATSPGGLGTGEGGDLIAVDDPHKADEVASEVQRESVINWWNVTMSSRTGRLGRTKRLVVMQRLHEKDLSGDILERGGYEHLCLEQEYERLHPFRRQSWNGWTDPRKEDGELLWPERFSKEWIESEQKPPRLSSTVYAGQYQQRPAPAEGSFFLRSWWKYHKQDPADLIIKAKYKCWSWDMAFKDLDDSDFVCGLAWCAIGQDFYLLPTRYHARMGFSASKIAVKNGKARYPGIHAILVEDKANGTAVIEDLKKGMSGLIGIEPEGGKESRAAVVQPYAEGGSIYLPDPSIAPWIDEYVNEMATFPNSTNDDYVDATSQAIVWLLGKMGRSFHLTWNSNKSFTGNRQGEQYRDPRFGEEVEFIPSSDRGDAPRRPTPKPGTIRTMRVVP